MSCPRCPSTSRSGRIRSRASCSDSACGTASSRSCERAPRGPRTIDALSHPALAQLHPADDGDTPERIGVLLASIPHRPGREANDVDLRRCHTAGHVARVRSIDRVTWLDPDTCCSPTSFEAAALAAGTAIEAAARGGFALVRPPGHHALPDRASALCLFCNVAVAARHVQHALGGARVAIVDWDAHHGNGTQAIVGEDPSILYVSLHQYGDGFFPGSGGPDDQGETTVNVPLAAGSGDAEYLVAFRQIVEPAVARFEPDLILVSAGFDAHRDDPASAMRLSATGFRELAARCAALGPRVAAVLEGGYNVRTLPALVEAALEGFES